MRAPRVLVVEDEHLVALALTEMLIEMGYEPVGPAATVSEALALLSAGPVHAAIVDFLLRKEESFPVAERLRVLEIPFILATAWPLGKLPRHWDGVPTISKPLAYESLRHVVRNLLHSDGARETAASG